MCKFCQWVDLIHELRKLGRTEELSDSSDDRLDGDNILRLYIVIRDIHLVLCSLDHLRECVGKAVLQKFTYCSDSSVSERVFIVLLELTITEVHNHACRADYVLDSECGLFNIFLFIHSEELLVELVASDFREIIAVGVVEEVLVVVYDSVAVCCCPDMLGKECLPFLGNVADI